MHGYNCSSVSLNVMLQLNFDSWVHVRDCDIADQSI